MPTFRVTSPDGQTYEIDGPEGSTEQDAIAEIQRQIGVAPARPSVAHTNPSEYDPTSPEYQAKYGATSGMSGTRKFLAGAGRGMMNIGRNVANIFGADNDQTIQDANTRDAELLNTGAGMAGNFLGETAVLTPLTLGVGAAANAARAGTMAARVLTNPVARGALEGATQGFVAAGPDNRLRGAALGGVAGSALPALGRGVSTVTKGLKRTPEAQRLLDIGIELTPGQMNPTGLFNHAEEAMQSAPLVGSAIRNARENAQDQFQRAVIERGSFNPLSKKGDLNDALGEAYESFEPMYAQAKGHAINAPSDVDITRAVMDPQIFADDAAREKVSRFVQNQLTALKTATPDSGDLLKIRSNVRQAARGAAKDPTKAAEVQLLNQVDMTLTQSIHSQLPLEARKALNSADQRYGLHKITESAVAKARDRPGGFTPTMLSQAVKESVGKGAYARGDGRLRDLAKAGAAAFDVKSPPTGARLGVLGALGATSYANPAVGLPVVGGILGLAGTQTGRRLAAGQTGFQKALEQRIQRLTHATPAQARELASIYSRGLLASFAVTGSLFD